MSRIDWLPRARRYAETCPICQERDDQRVLARAEHWENNDLLICSTCGSVFWTQRIEADYRRALTAGHAWFRLEHAESMESIVQNMQPLRGVVDTLGGEPVLADVGCGVGFGADYAMYGLGWRAIGYDPSPAASFSVEQIGAPLRTELFPVLDEPPANLVFSSEVVEHVEDVQGLLGALRDGMADAGYLLLTTPPAHMVWRSTPPAQFLSMLGRGQHLQYFSTSGLARALEIAGLQLMGTWVEGTRQVVLAGKGNVRAGMLSVNRFQPAFLMDYLTERWDATAEPAGSRVFGSRLFKLLVNYGNYDAAEQIWQRLHAGYRQLLGGDVTPDMLEAFAPRYAESGFSACEELPANLAMVTYLRGMLLLNFFNEPAEAARWFAAAGAMAEGWMTWWDLVAPTSGRDGELTSLTSLAPRHVDIALGK